MSANEVSFPPPHGNPLGTNRAYKFCATLLIPLLNVIAVRDWRGVANIPAKGPAIVASNHLSYSDVLFLAHFLYKNGRAPRFIGKASLFKVPILGPIITAAEQIPVDRESKDATRALDFAVAALRAGHMIGIYPEGTLTRDENLWPMVAKTGIARLAIITKNPVIPVAAWGPQKVLPRYGKIPHLWPRTKMTYWAGESIDLSRWYGREGDPDALNEATALIMKVLTTMLEELRAESAPLIPFDPHLSDLPRTGNFKKLTKKKAE